MNVYGVYAWENGSKYEGELKNGIRNGYGVYTEKNGDKYEGQYKDGKINGYGILYDKDGNVKQIGQWENDEFIED